MKKLSRWGIGPVFASLSILYGVATMVISRYCYPVFVIRIIPDRFLEIAGIVLILLGVPFFLVSVVMVTRAYNADQLVTGGVFRCCRHPLYASWVVLIVPGIVLLLKSWLSVTTPVFMYVILYFLVKKEEIYLENRFGDEYVQYKNRVPCIIPYGILSKKRT